MPITEPLFEYTVAELPQERLIESVAADMSPATLSHVTRMFLQAKRPMLITGQPMNPLLDEAVSLVGEDEAYIPDFVLYIGGSIVSKRLKRFLRKAKETWVVNATGEVTDTFMNLTHVFQGDGEAVADHIRFMLVMEPHPFVQQWDALLASIRQQAEAYEPVYSEMAAVKYFEHHVGDAEVHYAKAGFSCVTSKLVFCVIGDLSFFYDQNALWNQNLKGNLRILLLNNGKGGIFEMLPGLEQSPARDAFVAAEHHTSAEGICQENDIVYLSASDMPQMRAGIDTLLNIESSRPVLLEIFTSPSPDATALRDFYSDIVIKET